MMGILTSKLFYVDTKYIGALPRRSPTNEKSSFAQGFGGRREVRKMKMSVLDWVAWVLAVVGALNWGLIGVANYNLVTAIFGVGLITQVVYILVGVAGLYLVWMAYAKKK
jgi:uncharacterized membrane protein YuzA (DUF378 family)